MKEENNEMRRLSVFIETNGESVYVGEIVEKTLDTVEWLHADISIIDHVRNVMK